jgi:hypothetical protein
MKLKYILSFILLTALGSVSQAQISHRISLSWESPVPLVMGYDTSVLAPSFKNAQYLHLPENILPSFSQVFHLPEGTTSVIARISDMVYEELTTAEKQLTTDVEFPSSPEPLTNLMFERGNPRAVVSLVPFGMNPFTGSISRLKSFTLILDYQQSEKSYKNQHTYASNSVLSSGDWYKIFIRKMVFTS